VNSVSLSGAVNSLKARRGQEGRGPGLGPLLSGENGIDTALFVSRDETSPALLPDALDRVVFNCRQNRKPDLGLYIRFIFQSRVQEIN
jgi:hypothetical protein